jgi:hypothetical protein
MNTSSPTKAARLSLSLASTRGKQISGATGHRKRGVRCGSFRGEMLGGPRRCSDRADAGVCDVYGLWRNREPRQVFASHRRTVRPCHRAASWPRRFASAPTSVRSPVRHYRPHARHGPGVRSAKYHDVHATGWRFTVVLNAVTGSAEDRRPKRRKRTTGFAILVGRRARHE